MPADLAGELVRRGIRVTGRMGAGSSGTQLYHARSGSGDRLVVKILRQADNPVDGHDLATFRAKKVQIDQLRTRMPRLAGCYVPIIEEISGTGSAGHVMPYVEGDDLLAGARAGQQGVVRCAQLVAGVLAWLSMCGYAYQQRPAHPDDAVTAHVERIRRRLRFLKPPLIPAAAISGRGCRVNGLACQSLLPLLETITASSRLSAILRPRLVSPPVHGDLNTRNVLVREGVGPGFALIDPRGSLDLIDMGYDLGKIVLSATLWDPLLRLGASALPDGPDDDDVRVVVPVYSGYIALLSRLPAVLSETQPVADLLDRTGAWRARLAFIHAVHAVAEAACRVSDARARGLPPGDRGVVHTVRAFFFTGLLLLSDLCSRLQAADDIDLSEHWHVLHQVHRPVPAQGERS